MPELCWEDAREMVIKILYVMMNKQVSHQASCMDINYSTIQVGCLKQANALPFCGGFNDGLNFLVYEAMIK